jgi:hypothetical protein
MLAPFAEQNNGKSFPFQTNLVKDHAEMYTAHSKQ